MNSRDTPMPLEKYVELQRGNTYQGALLGQPGPVLLGLASIARNGGFRSDNLKTYGGQSDPRMLLERGDIYVSLKDVTQSADLLGAVARVPNSVTQGRLTQDTVKLVFKSATAPRDYIYWLLRTPEYREYCRAHATGTTNLGLPRDDFLAFPVPPPTVERISLAATLQVLDDKIELNRRMNETLEAMARAIFKDWFVDFGPTRAKMAMRGEDPQNENVARAPYLAPDVWSLFPDRLDADGKPQGWEFKKLGEIADYRTGTVNPGDTPDTIFEHYSLPAYDKGESPAVDLGASIKSNKTSIPADAVLLSKLNPEISRVWIPDDSTGVPQISSTEFLVFTPKEGFSRGLLYGLFQDATFRRTIEGMVTGTSKSHQRISPPALMGLDVIVGDDPAFKAFAVLTLPLLTRLVINRAESRTLAATRDLLLPKLMSGEVCVKDAERQVGEAT